MGLLGLLITPFDRMSVLLFKQAFWRLDEYSKHSLNLHSEAEAIKINLLNSYTFEISPPAYYTYFDSCSKTAIQCNS